MEAISNGDKLLSLCASGDEQECMMFLEQNTNCRFSRISKNGNTALTFACVRRMEKVCLDIISRSTSIQCDCLLDNINDKGDTALSLCCDRNMKKAIMKILETPDDCLLDHVNKHGYTPLMTVCQNKLEEVALKMLENPYKCGINKLDHRVGSAFSIGCQLNLENVCMKMLETPKLCTLDHIFSNNKTSFGYACDNNMECVYIKILENFKNCRFNKVDYNVFISLILLNSCKNAKENICGNILNNHSNYNLSTDPYYWNTLLLLACENQMVEIALKILSTPELCALDKITDIDHDTVLIIACRHQMEEICLKILDSPNDCALTHSNMIKTNARMLAKKHNMKKVYDIIVNKQNINKSKTRVRFENAFCGCFHMWE